MLTIEELKDLGYEIGPDPDQSGLFQWTNDQDGCELSFHTLKQAQVDASKDAFTKYELSRCDNCGKLHNEETLLTIRKLSQRVEPGGVVPSGECSDPDCGCLCYPLTEMQSDGLWDRDRVLDQIRAELSTRTDNSLLQVHNELCLKELVLSGDGFFKVKFRTDFVWSEGYDHIFSGKTPSLTRWVYDMSQQKLVFAQVKYVIGWVNLSDDEMKDLKMDIYDNDAIDLVDDFQLGEGGESELPSWAVGVSA